MSIINKKFEELRSKNEKALVAYIMVGYPNEKTTITAVKGIVKGGADIIELGFPFSDPLADGPVIQNASTVSLERGIKLRDFFQIVRKIRRITDVPLILMTYTNILYHKGYSNFISEAKKAGIDGFILPDMSVEESKEYLNAIKKHDLDSIFLISPNTSKKRIQLIKKVTSGFLYLVAVYGTTGIQSNVKGYTLKALKDAKKRTNNIPIGIGFGVSTPDDVKKYANAGADAVIVGSAFIKLIEKTPLNQLESKINLFTKSLKNQTKK